MLPKNTARLHLRQGRCMNCGLPAEVWVHDLTRDPAQTTTWCDFCAPTIFQMIAAQIRRANRRWDSGQPVYVN